MFKRTIRFIWEEVIVLFYLIVGLVIAEVSAFNILTKILLYAYTIHWILTIFFIPKEVTDTMYEILYGNDKKNNT